MRWITVRETASGSSLCYCCQDQTLNGSVNPPWSFYNSDWKRTNCISHKHLSSLSLNSRRIINTQAIKSRRSKASHFILKWKFHASQASPSGNYYRWKQKASERRVPFKPADHGYSWLMFGTENLTPSHCTETQQVPPAKFRWSRFFWKHSSCAKHHVHMLPLPPRMLFQHSKVWTLCNSNTSKHVSQTVQIPPNTHRRHHAVNILAGREWEEIYSKK